MKIGTISKQTGLSIDTIRFYEKQKLFVIRGRTPGGYREYNSESIELLNFIAKCRALDISIPDIRKLLDVRSRSAKSCREANIVIAEQLKNLRRRIKELKTLESNLAQLRSVCNQELEPSRCEIIKALDSGSKRV